MTPRPVLRGLQLRGASLAYAALLGLAMVAFWPGYLVKPAAASGWTHFHAITATLWLLLLIAQPIAIYAGRRELHRQLGRYSPALALLMVAGFIGLAHASMAGKTGMEAAVGAYFFYVRVVLVSTFVFCFAMGWLYRREAEIHARFMVCTGLAAIDPIVHRIAARLSQGADLNYQLLTFGLACAVLVALIVAEWRLRARTFVFPLVLAVTAVMALPLWLDFHTWGEPWRMWKALAAAFASLPIP
ncbi:MAG: hypothetical protein ABIQ72_15725 [Usitatibacter sp.]